MAHLNPGLVLGKYGKDKGKNVWIVSFGPKLYDMDGKEQNGIWSTTHENGLFYIDFQVDPVEIARFIDPETSKFRFRGDSKEGEDPDHQDEKFYLVLNVKYLLNRGRPSIKDAPAGSEKWIDKAVKFATKHSEFVNKVLSQSTILTKKMITTEMWCATGVAIVK